MSKHNIILLAFFTRTIPSSNSFTYPDHHVHTLLYRTTPPVTLHTEQVIAHESSPSPTNRKHEKPSRTEATNTPQLNKCSTSHPNCLLLFPAAAFGVQGSRSRRRYRTFAGVGCGQP
ncbi:hypothetical protein KC19_4G054200 [Ceratodon purpureus]|uniref:Uncharacterized protein n=1 Tax=Ceratodon purpureus TaxID=3225 RepID=A0A8T0I8Q9_CERPU|nr:hypothetical protein KC19_4G054200 [Ceratodon purpureus]